MSPKRVLIFVVAVALVAGGLGIGLAYAAGRRSSSQAVGTSGTADGSSYSYYESMMGRFGSGSMMGGSGGSSSGTESYGWMMGGTNAPGWMDGASLPSDMMGTDTNPGKVMGELFANAPGPRVSPSEATKLGEEDPTGGTVDIRTKRISFSGSTAKLVAVASPPGSPDDTFRISGLADPTISVKTGTQVSIEVVNADPDAAHGFVVVGRGSASSSMPMVTARPAFRGAALWFLGNPTWAGMHSTTIDFDASVAGTYQYLCAVPGHAQRGMVGTFVVTT
jgi:rusticyanin